VDQKKLVNFLSFWVANTVILLLASAILGSNVVLGNDKISKPVAAIIAGLILTALIFIIPPIIEKSGYKIKNENIWPAIFFVGNIIVIWIIKRIAVISGVGISNILWVLILGVIVTLVELVITRATGAMKLRVLSKK